MRNDETRSPCRRSPAPVFRHGSWLTLLVFTIYDEGAIVVSGASVALDPAGSTASWTWLPGGLCLLCGFVPPHRYRLSCWIIFCIFSGSSVLNPPRRSASAWSSVSPRPGSPQHRTSGSRQCIRMPCSSDPGSLWRPRSPLLHLRLRSPPRRHPERAPRSRRLFSLAGGFFVLF